MIAFLAEHGFAVLALWVLLAVAAYGAGLCFMQANARRWL